MARPALSARGQWARIVAAVPAIVAIFFFGQGVLDRGGWRLDLTPERRYTLSDRAIVAAKMTACLLVVALLVGATILYPVWVYRVQPFDTTPLVAGYVGLMLLAAACVAYGLFISALTDSQVLAAFLTAMPLLLLWLLSWNEAANAEATLPLVRAVSLFDHFQPFAVGVIEARDVFYFLALTVGFTWATHRALEARQWRGRR